ncbi:HD domain-containing protein [Vibrio sp. Vb2880]|uniref:HD-GYP domain-containing protein n=1 Tax=Vibrio sp. Vb2880 TaxID=2816076 RepID=UPI001A8D1822|nr:HD domain-containing phosphohydrolase [Vibrio sp. Vb2880]MBO0213715.1 HD domain-containing protein [Vibrio sp. Vb2880]
MNDEKALNIDLRQMIMAIEKTVSLVGMNDTNHGKRVGAIAYQIAREAGCDDEDVQSAFELGMLHDCGVSTAQMHSTLVNHFDSEDAHIHCDIGYRLLRNFAPLAKYAVPILYHHTPWRELEHSGINERDVRMANLIFLADRIDVLGVGHYETDILLINEQIVQSIRGYADHYFSPQWVQAFERVQRTEAFWMALEDRYVTRLAWEMGQSQNPQMLSLAQVKQLSMILSYIVDQKSRYTAKHSMRVADVARSIGVLYGLSESRCDKIEIAGLLHDLGKLNVPDDILDKPGPLTDYERSVMMRHSYETYDILRSIEGLGEMARWAAFHHEGVNGVGYPFHPQEHELSIEARMIAVADVFQALVQHRPYRKGMSQPIALALIDGMADAGKLDRRLVDLVIQHAETLYAIAKGADPNHNQAYLNLMTA